MKEELNSSLRKLLESNLQEEWQIARAIMLSKYKDIIKERSIEFSGMYYFGHYTIHTYIVEFYNNHHLLGFDYSKEELYGPNT